MKKGPCGEKGLMCIDDDAYCFNDECTCLSTFTVVEPEESCAEPEAESLGPHVVDPEFPEHHVEPSRVTVIENTTSTTTTAATPGSKTIGNKNEAEKKVGGSNHSGVFFVKEVIPTYKHPRSTTLKPTLKEPIASRTNVSGSSSLLNTVLPIALGTCALLAIIAVVIFLCRRKKRSQGSRQGSPISWMRRHDGFTVIDNMETLLKNPNYYSMSPDANHPSIFKEKEIALSRLHLLEVIGEGAFGQVYKGELRTVDGEGSITVAVKLLKEGLSREIREDFEREVEITSAFRHENILPLVGVVTKDSISTPYIVLEYMRHGDLASLLRKNDPIMREHENEQPLLKQTDLVDICMQVANGMQYLASQHFVHRDLATRNCLVGEDLVVKISDFGMSRDIYTSDYYRVGGSRMLPVRWMAPECIRYGRFTTESDIWAFGVVLWEVFSFGKQPYYGHSNEEVVCFINEGILLQRPPDSTQTVYTLMLSCWRENPNARVPFCDIYKYLEEYNKSFKREFQVCTHAPDAQIVQCDADDVQVCSNAPNAQTVECDVGSVRVCSYAPNAQTDDDTDNVDDDDNSPVLVERDLERLEYLREDIV